MRDPDAPDRYKKFRETPLGAALAEIAEDEARYGDYLLLAKTDLPSVGAVVPIVLQRHPEVKNNAFAQQALGAFVGTVMYGHGHEVKRRGRVKPPGLIGVGTVWTV